jgi:hypothetical protein
MISSRSFSFFLIRKTFFFQNSQTGITYIHVDRTNSNACKANFYKISSAENQERMVVSSKLSK